MISSHAFDYIWKALLISASSSSLVFFSLLLMLTLFSNLSPKNAKRLFQFHFLILVASLLAGLAFVTRIQPELWMDCFPDLQHEKIFSLVTQVSGALWISGFLVLFARDLRAIAIDERRVHFLPDVTNESTGAVMRELQNRVSSRRKVSLKVSRRNESPFATGLFHSCVVIPESLSDDSRALRAVLGHELTHVAEHDARWLLLELLCRRFLFWNPLSYWAHARFHQTLELFADENSVRHSGVNRNEMMSILVRMTEMISLKTSGSLQMEMSSGFRLLRSRIRSLAEPRSDRGLAWHGFVGFGSIVLLSLSIAESRALALGQNGRPQPVGLICAQVEEAKIVSTWFASDPPTVRQCDRQTEKQIEDR